MFQWLVLTFCCLVNKWPAMVTRCHLHSQVGCSFACRRIRIRSHLIICINWSSTTLGCYRISVLPVNNVRPLGKNGFVSTYRENSYSSSPAKWLEKADRTSSHLMVGHYEERPIIWQPQCGRCHQAGTGQFTLEVIGSKWSCALNCCKPNNDDDAK